MNKHFSPIFLNIKFAKHSIIERFAKRITKEILRKIYTIYAKLESKN